MLIPPAQLASAWADVTQALGGAAALAAAGAGVITDAFTKAGEAADEARDSAFQFAYDVSGALDTAGYSQRVAAWTSDTEKLKQAQDIAKVAGMEVSDVIDALASGGDKLDGVWDAFARGAASTGIATGRALELESALNATREGYLNGADAAKMAENLIYQCALSVGEATGATDDLGNAIYRHEDREREPRRESSSGRSPTRPSTSASMTPRCSHGVRR